MNDEIELHIETEHVTASRKLKATWTIEPAPLDFIIHGEALQQVVDEIQREFDEEIIRSLRGFAASTGKTIDKLIQKIDWRNEGF